MRSHTDVCGTGKGWREDAGSQKRERRATKTVFYAFHKCHRLEKTIHPTPTINSQQKRHRKASKKRSALHECGLLHIVIVLNSAQRNLSGSGNVQVLLGMTSNCKSKLRGFWAFLSFQYKEHEWHVMGTSTTRIIRGYVRNVSKL